jgi:SPP1 gp7 family putative phage head morphogenesis protein
MPIPEQEIERNVKLMNNLIKKIRNDINGAKQYAKDMQDFLSRVAIFTEINPLLTERYTPIITEIVQSINNTMQLPIGGHREVFKEVAKNETMELVTNMGEDMKTDLKTIVSDGVKQGQAPDDISKTMRAKVESLGKTRAEAIARTETMRTKNLGNWYIYNEKDYGYFVVPANGKPGDWDKCRTYLNKVYSMEERSKLPPYHPRCTHSPSFFRTLEDAEEYLGDKPALKAKNNPFLKK